MLVHTCRCILLIVLIGFYYKKKMITKLFENVFGKLEIEKEKEIPSSQLLARRPAAAPPLLAHSASSTGSPASLIRVS
jgi:hypothetical protein